VIFISDLHGAAGPLRRLVETGEILVILGDLVNLTDYRSGEGAVAAVLGIEFAQQASTARGRGDYAGMRHLWQEAAAGRIDEVRTQIAEEIGRQYEEVAEALQGGHGLVIHGNVDRPSLLREILPSGFRYVHGEVVEVEGFRLGLVGGGVPTALQAEGEISDEEMRSVLEDLGPVDVLGTHVSPALRPLRNDVVTGREERGSAPILDYIRAQQPPLHIYGDVHQAQAIRWRVGSTHCVNAGYFRATGRFIRLDGAGVQVGRVG
jgi:Icc-related predicted phosphoesterase